MNSKSVRHSTLKMQISLEDLGEYHFVAPPPFPAAWVGVASTLGDCCRVFNTLPLGLVRKAPECVSAFYLPSVAVSPVLFALIYFYEQGLGYLARQDGLRLGKRTRAGQIPFPILFANRILHLPWSFADNVRFHQR